MNPDNRAADVAGLGVPADPIADFESLRHLLASRRFRSTILKRVATHHLYRVVHLCTLHANLRPSRACEEVLPHGARPVLQLSSTARILIASQAPGTKVHESGIPFSDASGARLREWTGMSAHTFYDRGRIAILPMGLCYPGRAPGSGDAPPRPECAPLWRDRLLSHIRDVRLTLLVGTHAQTATLGPGKLTERVRAFRDHMPALFPLPHPSWRSHHWAAQNPWFEADVLPALRSAVQRALA
jgi:uracil-DNA glycosylase